ncbi:MAG: hypothetical protein ABSH45_18670 [Bryobacteraceae bacterium]|jgi:hypothetical protein
MGWLLATVFLLAAFGHLGLALRWFARGKSASLLPFIGGLAGMAACFLPPFPSLARWWRAPPIADLGTGYLFAATIVFLFRRAFKRPPSDGPAPPLR